MQTTTSDIISPQELKVLEWLKNNNLTNYLSDFVERPDAYTRIISGIMGWQWEDEFMTLCELHNFVVQKAGLNNRYDCIVNNKYKVQCKFSASKNKIDIRNKDKENNRRYKKEDFDFMAIRNIQNTYIVPIECLLENDLTQTRMNVNIDELRPFKDNFEVLE